MSVDGKGAMDLDKAHQNLSNNGTASSYAAPKTILEAYSEIQQYHVFEKTQEKDIDKNFFTLSQVWDFFKAGFRSGFWESLIFVTFLPFFQTIYPSFKQYFLGAVYTNEERLALFAIAYLPILIVTIWLASLYRLYDGALTKKAIFSLLSGRSLAFLIKGLIIYYVFGYIYNMATYDPDYIYVFINDFKFIIDWLTPGEYTYKTKDLFNYFYLFIVPAIKSTASEATNSMLVLAIVPFLAVVSKGIYKTYKKQKSEVVYDEL